jgi:exonuclease III
MKIVSLNIEMDRHYQTVVPFIKKERPDVLCLQEVYEEDLSFLLENFPPYKHTFFTPMTRKKENAEVRTFGHLIATNHPSTLLSLDYYYTLNKDPHDIPWFDREHVSRTVNRALTVVDVEIDGVPYTIGNTHFTWTPDGMPDAQQRKDMPRLLALVKKHSDMVLCGDFNIPRGINEQWETLTKHFTDNIPPHIDNTLDPTYHRVPGIKRAVDGLFTTSGYSASNVEVRCGLSDHCGIITTIEKESQRSNTSNEPISSDGGSSM